MTFKVWLDHAQSPPNEDWLWARDVIAAKMAIYKARAEGLRIEISFGTLEFGQSTAFDLALAIRKHANGRCLPFPIVKWNVHSKCCLAASMIVGTMQGFEKEVASRCN